MAFGFVVKKFALFIKQIGFFFSSQGITRNTDTSSVSQNYTSIFGILLVAVGAFMGLFAYIQYRQISKQIEEKRYYSSAILTTALAALVVIVGIFLVAYLVET
jgi:putative membrane protein